MYPCGNWLRVHLGPRPTSHANWAGDVSENMKHLKTKRKPLLVRQTHHFLPKRQAGRRWLRRFQDKIIMCKAQTRNSRDTTFKWPLEAAKRKAVQPAADAASFCAPADTANVWLRPKFPFPMMFLKDTQQIYILVCLKTGKSLETNTLFMQTVESINKNKIRLEGSLFKEFNMVLLVPKQATLLGGMFQSKTTRKSTRARTMTAQKGVNDETTWKQQNPKYLDSLIFGPSPPPDFNNNCTDSKSPDSAARCKAVIPVLFLASTSAKESNKICSSSTCWTAKCTGDS